MNEIEQLQRKVNGLIFAVAVLSFVVMLLLADRVLGQSPDLEARRALVWAKAHPQQAPYARFLTMYAMVDTKRGYLATSYAANLISSAGAIIAPEWDRQNLVVLDIGVMFPSPQDVYTRGHNTWDAVALRDPYFRLGKELGGWVDPNVYRELQALTHSKAPIMRAEWFIKEAMTAKVYYAFRGVAETKDEYYKSLGLDEKLIINLRIVRAANIAQSKVTHQLRRATLWPIPTGQLHQTFDSLPSAKSEKDPFSEPSLSLKFDASELIATMPNGLHEFTIFLASGKRADVVDPALAIDDSGPRPIPLAPPFSCVRCHATTEPDGRAANGLRHYTDAQIKLLTGPRTFATENPETAAQVAGLYFDSGKLQRDLNRGRIDYIEAVAKLSQPLVPRYSKWPASVQEAADCLDRVVTGYNDGPVTPQQAVRELGINGAALPVEAIRKIGYESNSAPVKMLNDGLSISRSQFESVFAELSILAMAQRGPK